jgi:hypothetical protein
VGGCAPGVAPGVAPPNDAVLSAVRNNSYNRFNIIRIPEVYKGREIAGPPRARKEFKENQVLHPPRKELKEHRRQCPPPSSI